MSRTIAKGMIILLFTLTFNNDSEIIVLFSFVLDHQRFDQPSFATQLCEDFS